MKRETGPRLSRAFADLTYFPELHPGELIYSVIARYALHQGYSQRIAQETLFGRARLFAPVALPFDLDFLARKLPAAHRVPSRRLIEQHTLLPYYAAFLPSALRDRATELMLGPDGQAGLLLGVGSLPLGPLPRLRFCNECFDEMISDHGEAYWKRDQQLPIAMICTKHGTDLRASTVQLASHSYIPANRDSCPRDAPLVLDHAADPDRLVLRRLSERALDLLSGSLVPSDYVEHVVVGGFARKGFRRGRAMTQFDHQALNKAADAALSRVRTAFPTILLVGKAGGRWWDDTIKRNGPENADRVLLAELLLDYIPSVDPKPFGEGPWPCLNPLAEHCEELTITDPPQLSERENRGVTGIFVCGCGYVYSQRRRGSGRPFTGPKDNPKRVAFGPALGKLLRDAETFGWTIEQAASRARINSNKLLMIVIEDGLALPQSWQPLTAYTRKQIRRSMALRGIEGDQRSPPHLDKL